MMASCNDCIHNEICQQIEGPFNIIDADMNCADFKLRSRFVELPCHVGDTVTTIDEAIDHCYQIATSTDENVCAECKAEHMRLCGWLSELKRRRATEQELEVSK